MSRVIRIGTAGAMLTSLTVLGGCDCREALVSEGGQLGFDDPFRYSIGEPFRSGEPVVEGSRFCPDVVQWYEGAERTCVPISARPQEWFEPCWEQSVDGPAELDAGGCVTFVAPGLVRWNIEPCVCEVEVDVPEFGPDSVSFDVLAVEGLQGTAVWEFERTAEALRSPGPAGAFPSDWTEPLGGEVRLVEGEIYWALLGLYDPQSQEPVASSIPSLISETLEGVPSATLLEEFPLVELDLKAGDQVRLDQQLAHEVIPGPTVVGVSETDVAELSLVPAYRWPEGDELWGPPTGVRAVIRDAEGRILRASVVQWTVQGIDLRESDPAPTADILRLPSDCTDGDPRERRATVTAQIGGAVDSVDLQWLERKCTEVPPDPFDPPTSFDLDIDCACQAGRRGSPAGAALLLLLFASRRRR